MSREIPILMNAEMVRALLDGKKTQARKPVNYIPALGEPSEWCERAAAQEPEFVRIVGNYQRFSPFGQPGDRLWVRETWGVGTRPDPRFGWRDGIEYRADEYYLEEHDLLPLYPAPDDVDLEKWMGQWRPSIHMPKWATRFWLPIKRVWVERVHDISADDASYVWACEFEVRVER